MSYSIEELKNNMCKWPSGDPKHDDFHFCGNDARDPDSSYCEFHTKLAYRESARPVKKAA